MKAMIFGVHLVFPKVVFHCSIFQLALEPSFTEFIIYPLIPILQG